MDTESKVKSRKFIVWIVWFLIVAAVVVISAIKNISDNLVSEVISDFFYVSMMYLGMNVGQKGVTAIADAIGNLGNKNEENNSSDR